MKLQKVFRQYSQCDPITKICLLNVLCTIWYIEMHIATQINDTPYVTGCNLQKGSYTCIQFFNSEGV